MGFLNLLFGGSLNNPALVSAAKKYAAESSEDHLAELWQRFLKSKIVLATKAEAAKEFGKVRQMKEAVGLPFNTTSNERGDTLLVVYSDSNSFQASNSDEMQSITVTGEQAYRLASAKGLFGLSLRVAGIPPAELKCWQHQIFIERTADAAKLLSLASKLMRSSNFVDAEGVLKGAILVAQRESGLHSPFTAQLTLELAHAQRMQGKLNEAEWTYRRALGIYEACGEHEMERAATAEAIGGVLFENNKSMLAIPFLEHALEILERRSSVKPDVIARILCQLGDIQCDEGKWEEGEILLKRALRTLEERKHPDLMSILNKLGALCEKSARPKEALGTYMRAIAVFDTMRRCRDYDLGRAAQRAAAIHMDSGKYAEARPLLERALLAFRRDGSMQEITFVENLLVQVGELELKESQQEQDASQGSDDDSGGSGGKGFSWRRVRRQQLPLLDMQIINPAAKSLFDVAESVGLAPSQSPMDPEEQALQQMRAFLDTMNTGNEADGAAGARQTDEHGHAPSEPRGLLQTILPEQAEKVAGSAAGNNGQEPAADDISLSQEDSDEVMGLFDLLGLQGGVMEEAPPAIPAAAAPKIMPPPPSSASPQKHPTAPPAQNAEPGNISAAKAAAAAPQAQDNQSPPLFFLASENEVGQAIASDISTVINKSVLHTSQKKNDRYDRPISDRVLPEKVSQPGIAEGSGTSTRADEPAVLSDAASQSTSLASKAAPPVESKVPPPAAAEPIGAESSKLEGKNSLEVKDKPESKEKDEAKDKPEAKDKDEANGKPEVKEKDEAIDKPESKEKDEANGKLEAKDRVKLEDELDVTEINVPAATGEIAKEPSAQAAQTDSPIIEDKDRSAVGDDLITEETVKPAQVNEAGHAQGTGLSAPDTTAHSAANLPVSESQPAENTASEEEEEEVISGSFEDANATDSPDKVRQLNARLSSAKQQLSLGRSKLEHELEISNPQSTILRGSGDSDNDADSSEDESGLSGARTLDELLHMLEQKLQSEPNNSELLLRKGTALVQQKKIDEAIRVFDKVTSLSPDDIYAWYCKGSSLHLKDRFEDAVYCFNHVLSRDKENIKAMLRKAECLLRLGRPDQGMTLFDRIITIKPKFTPAWLSKGRALLKQQRFAEALACYEEVLQFESDNQEALRGRELISNKLGNQKPH